MEPTRPITPADLTVRVAIPEVFAANVGLVADMNLYRQVPPEALAFVLRRHIHAVCGDEEGEESILSIVELGLDDYFTALEWPSEDGPPPAYDGYADVAIPRPVVVLAVEGLLRRKYESLDPAVFGFVMQAIVEHMHFHAPTDGALDPAALVNIGIDWYEAARDA